MPRLPLAFAVVVLLARPAFAELQVRMPEVDYLEFEFEHNGLVTFDTKGSPLRNAQSYTNSIGYGVLPWWEIELEGEMASGGGQTLTWNAMTLENTFQLTEPGQYFFTLGFFFEYSQSTLHGEPSGVTFGPIIQKELNDVFGLDTLHTLNLFLSRDVGHDATKAHRLPVCLAVAGLDASADLARRRVLRHHSGPRACRPDHAATALGRPGAGWSGQFRAVRQTAI